MTVATVRGRLRACQLLLTLLSAFKSQCQLPFPLFSHKFSHLSASICTTLHIFFLTSTLYLCTSSSLASHQNTNGITDAFIGMQLLLILYTLITRVRNTCTSPSFLRSHRQNFFTVCFIAFPHFYSFRKAKCFILYVRNRKYRSKNDFKFLKKTTKVFKKIKKSYILYSPTLTEYCILYLYKQNVRLKIFGKSRIYSIFGKSRLVFDAMSNSQNIL